ncbi:diadenylate cyclase [Sorangium sp. So ce764]|uniref:DNA integrity scanning protein DisA nucleotide-binding domain protein n=1 Tax=Sorangium sp. So ce764 TaxID=3133320 RepID=UPI003F646B2F
MGKSITLFMWAYQHNFRFSVEYRARDTLQTVAPGIEPRALLIGVRTTETTEGHPVCVEPEDGQWDPKIFFGCTARTDQIFAAHPDHSIHYGDAPSMRDKPENIRKKSVRDAVREVTDAYDAQHGTESFCGWPAKVNGYHVVPVLQFDKADLAKHPRLPSPIRFQDWTSSIGLIDSLVERLLDEATQVLGGSKEPGRHLDSLTGDKSSLLRSAADRFCSAITLATRDVMFQGLFEAINIISSIPYEGAEAIGEIVFAPQESEAVELRVKFDSPVSIYEHRLARKVIEMSSPELSCLCYGSSGIAGLGSIKDVDADSVFRVVFTGHYKWDLYHRGQVIMKAAFGLPQLPSVRLSEGAFCTTARRIIPGLDAEDAARLWRIVEAAMEQKHGTMIVVSESAEAEARRLKKQALAISPIELSADLVRRLSGIDGAVLVDPKGVCHAIGVILDGMATNEGDPARGARYNSAIRYIATAKTPTMCLVVSEDGYVNVFPVLRPQILKSDIEKNIALLKTQTIDNYHKTIKWLDDHRFYLTAEQCDVVNYEFKRIRSAPAEVGEARVVFAPFEANVDMNESYYLPEE